MSEMSVSPRRDMGLSIGPPSVTHAQLRLAGSTFDPWVVRTTRMRRGGRMVGSSFEDRPG
jgi:hypothetical protein